MFSPKPTLQRHCKKTDTVMLARQQAERQTRYNCGLGVCAVGQHGRRAVDGFLVVFFIFFLFFLILCNDAPKATVDGGAERSRGRGTHGWGWLCAGWGGVGGAADLMHI